MIKLWDRTQVVKALDGNSRSTSRSLIATLRAMSEQPAVRERSDPPEPDAITVLGASFPNFSEVTTYLAEQLALSRLQPMGPFHFAPLLLNGPPGIGKSAFAFALAKALGVTLRTTSMAYPAATFSLRGADSVRADGGPGWLVRQLAQAEPDPVVLLDDVDKVPDGRELDLLVPLYSLLDLEYAKQFMDEGLQVPVNCSAVRWIATSTSTMPLHPSIRSLFEIFESRPPTREQSMDIARSMYDAFLNGSSWGRHFQPTLTDSVLALLAGMPPRAMRRSLEDACGRAALQGRFQLKAEDVTATGASQSRVGSQP